MKIDLLQLGFVQAREETQVLHHVAYSLCSLKTIRDYRIQIVHEFVVVDADLYGLDQRRHILRQVYPVVSNQQLL